MSDEEDKTSKLLDISENRKMSSSLKVRLKQSSRSFSSPISRSSSIQSSKSDDKTALNAKGDASLQNKDLPLASFPQDFESSNDQQLLQQICLDLKTQISDNEKKLQKLELVEHYHLKNKPDELIILIKKWLTVSQESLRKLHEKLPEDKGDFKELLRMLNIDYNVVQYDPDCDAFY